MVSNFNVESMLPQINETLSGNTSILSSAVTDTRMMHQINEQNLTSISEKLQKLTINSIKNISVPSQKVNGHTRFC